MEVSWCRVVRRRPTLRQMTQCTRELPSCSEKHWLREQMCAVVFLFSDLTALLMYFSVIHLLL